MSDTDGAPGRHGRGLRCPYPWCTTAHGETLHEQDEDHRSRGEEVVLAVRHPLDPARVRLVTAEIGLLRRVDDAETWLVVEDGRAPHAEITVSSARALLRALAADPAVAAELEPRAAAGLGPSGDGG